MDFYFTRTATESVRRLSYQFSQAQDHILLKNRLKIGQYKTRTADCGLRTTDCGLGIKYGLGIKRGLENTDWV